MTDQFFGWSGVMLVAAVLACGTSDSGFRGQTAPDATSPPASAGDWRPLFDGKTTSGWRGYHQQTMPGGWQAVNGALTRVSQGGDIITIDQFDSFELELEWQIAEGGNSGIMYRVSEDGDEAYYTGPEYQLLDNARHADGKNPLTSAASDYGLYAPVKDVTRPIGEWNAARILVKGNHVEHWLNGVKVVEYELGSPDWQQRVDASKFKQWPNYGRIPKGHIALQDHGSQVAFRNIRIR
jgi:3-keto-disaccharide hydrolase